MVAFLIILLALSVFMILFGHRLLSVWDRKYLYPKRLAKVQGQSPQYPPSDKLPAPLPPAIVSQLICFGGRSDSTGKSYTRFTVTLLDLVHRGKIKVARDGDQLIFTPLSDGEGMLPFERTLLNFLREACGDARQIRLAEIEAYIEEHREKSAEMRSRFLREVVDDFLSRGYSKEQSYEVKFHPLMMIGVGTVAASWGALLGWLAHHIPLGVISMCFAAIAALLSVQVFSYTIPYLTKDGLAMRGKWHAYNQFLSALTPEAGKSLPADRLSEIAVYAAALENQNAMKQLASVWRGIPKCQLYEPYYFQKLCQIDRALLFSNIHIKDARDLAQVKKR